MASDNTPGDARPSSLWRRLRGRNGDEQRRPAPWRVEGMPDDSSSRPAERQPRRRSFWGLFLAALAINWILASIVMGPPSRTDVSYTFFTEQLDRSNVDTVTSTADTIQGEFTKAVDYPAGSKDATRVELFTTQRPTFATDDLLGTLETKDVTVNATDPDAAPPLWQQVLVGFGPTLLLIGLGVWFLRRRAASGLGALGGFGKSKATLYQPDARTRTTFADVAGIDEVQHEVREIVDFLRDPQRYTRLGARIPHGVLLSGPPGTGKTLLARAVAGEAKVPFFSISASEFIEMIVGVGASRVRDLFDQAKKVAPSIIFIDELDAIGRSRGGAQSLGGNDEREQTLNQILTEMDGFTGNEGVVVLAATNRPEILDAALLRPGRFDRRVTVSAPDLPGRRQILEVHTRSVPLAADVDLEALAASTPGMVGADLKNLVNEAALLAARRRHETVKTADFSDALE